MGSVSIHIKRRTTFSSDGPENPGQKAPISVPAPTALAPAESVVTALHQQNQVVPILMTEDPQKTKTKVKMESFEADAYNHPLAEEYILSEKSMLLGERVEDMPEQEVMNHIAPPSPVSSMTKMFTQLERIRNCRHRHTD